MSFWDWKSGHRFQSFETTAQPGSLDAESGIMSSTFDRSGLRLITGEADKTSKCFFDVSSPSVETRMLTFVFSQSKYGNQMKKRLKRRTRYSGRQHWHKGNFSQEFLWE